jgi:hypothetical protein
MDDFYKGYLLGTKVVTDEAAMKREVSYALNHYREHYGEAGEILLRHETRYMVWFGLEFEGVPVRHDHIPALAVYIRGKDSNDGKASFHQLGETSRQARERQEREAGRRPRKAKLSADI